MIINEITTQLLAEAIANSIPDKLKKSFFNIKYSYIAPIPGLRHKLEALGLKVVTTNQSKSKAIIIADRLIQLDSNKAALSVIIQPNVIKKTFKLDEGLTRAKRLGGRLAFFEYLGKPYIQKNNFLCAVISSAIPSGRIVSKIHVTIIDLSSEYINQYKSHSSLPVRLKRIMMKIVKVAKFQSMKIIGPLMSIWPLKIFYKLYIKKYIIETMDPLPKGRGGDKSLAICINWLDSGGVERVTLNLIKDLKKRGFEIHLMTTVKGDNPWDNIFRKECASVTHLHQILGLHHPTPLVSQYVLSEWVMSTRASTLMITNSIAAYEALPSIKLVSKNISVFDVLHTHGTPNEKDAYLRLSMPYLKYLDKRVVIDEYLKDYYLERYPVNSKDIQVIYNGLDESVRNKKIKIQKDSSKDGKIHIAYMGRLDSDKSPERLIEIAKLIKERGLSAVMDIYGDGSEAQSVRDLAKRYNLTKDSIVFHGRSSNALEDIARADYSILVSNSEGIPMSILESMHVGTPCIAPAVGGIPEMIDNEKDGILFYYKSDIDAERVKIIVDCVIKSIKLADSKRHLERLALNARKKVLGKFGHMTDDYVKLIESIRRTVS